VWECGFFALLEGEEEGYCDGYQNTYDVLTVLASRSGDV